MYFIKIQTRYKSITFDETREKKRSRARSGIPRPKKVTLRNTKHSGYIVWSRMVWKKKSAVKLRMRDTTNSMRHSIINRWEEKDCQKKKKNYRCIKQQLYVGESCIEKFVVLPVRARSPSYENNIFSWCVKQMHSVSTVKRHGTYCRNIGT